jgi:signal transduction histidine kinase
MVLSQDSFELVDYLRKYELDSIELDKRMDDFSKEMLNWQVNFLKSFEIDENQFQRLNLKDDCIEDCFIATFYFYINSGDYLFYKYHSKNTEVKAFYIKALEYARETGSLVLECEALKRILNLNRQTYLRDNISSYEYLDRYKEIAYDNIEVAYYEYYNLILSFQYYKIDKWIPDSSNHLLSFAKNSSLNYLNANIYQLHAIYEHALGNNGKAVLFEEMAIKELEKIPFGYKSTSRKNSKYALARYHIYNNSPKEAKENLQSISLNPKNRIEKENQKYFYLYSSMLDSISGDYFSAYSNFRNYNNLNVFNTIQKNQNAFNELETKYQTAEKEKQILEEQQKVRVNRNWLIVAGFTLLFGAGIAFLLQNNTTKKRLLAEQEALLKQERVDNLLKEQELVSIDAMIAGQEKERQRVANELHDDLGSLMATIKLHFDNSKVSKKDPALKNAQKLLEEAYQKVRGMAHSKNSGVMSDQGLLPAIKKMAQVITETNALEVVVEDFGMGDRLENSLELNLFRMVQELVANAIKHAEASKVSIQLTQHEDNLNIIIEDNGKGFDRSKVDASKTGMGLTTIEKRVEHLEGNFTVDSILGKGTSILIDIPV